jgi:hypothetical protein
MTMDRSRSGVFRSFRRAAARVAASLVLLDAAAAAQSELVIHKEGTNLYHRPGCPVVRDGIGVLALTRAQAEARGYKPHPDCDPDNPSARSAPAVPRPVPAPAPAPPPAVTVYLDGSKYYHRKSCAKIATAKDVASKSLEVAGKSYWPCPVCRPPVRRKSSEPAVPGTVRRGR